MADTNEEALAEATAVCNTVNAIVRTMKSDDVVTLARGMCVAAVVMAGTDQAARTQVAIEMVRQALLLDPHIAEVTWN